MEYFSAQVLQKDVGGRLQVGQELLLYLGAPGAIPDLEEDQSRLGKTVDALTGWVGSSNYRVSGGSGAGHALSGRPFNPGRERLGGGARRCPEPQKRPVLRRGNPGVTFRGPAGQPAPPREPKTYFPPRPSFSTFVKQ